MMEEPLLGEALEPSTANISQNLKVRVGLEEGVVCDLAGDPPGTYPNACQANATQDFLFLLRGE
jgi:hypothetical protein